MLGSFDNTGTIWIHGEKYECKTGQSLKIGDEITVDFDKDLNKVIFLKNKQIEGEFSLKCGKSDIGYFAVSSCQNDIGVSFIISKYFVFLKFL